VSQALHWRCCRLDALTPQELHRIHIARQQVFVVEQACAFQDADEADEAALHLAAWSVGQPVPLAYARLVPPGVKYAEPAIGRVITTGSARGGGLGRELMRRATDACGSHWPGLGIRISAQSRLERFYVGFGFIAVGERYLEDGIPHTEMLRAPG